MNNYSFINLIGNTPIVQLKKIINESFANVFVKLEGNVSAEGIPETLDISVIDKTISVSIEKVKEMAKLLSVQEGLCLGISSCANIVAAVELAEELGKGKNVVTVSHDFGSNYLNFYKDLFKEEK